MARPKKRTVDYFPHTCNHGKTIFILEQKYGNDGYAFWFKLLEMLGTSEGHYLQLENGEDWEFLQAKTRLDGDTCQEILNLLATLEAIDKELWINNRVVWCDKFVENIEDVYRNRRVEIPEKPSFYKQKPSKKEVSTDENPQTKLNKTKVKEIKYTQNEKEILDYWNKQGITKHEETENMKKEISKALKKHGKEKIIEAITNYAVAYSDTSFYYSHRWRLDKFLTQNNGLPDWVEGGQRYIDYQDKGGADSGQPEQPNAEHSKPPDSKYGHLYKF